MKKIYSLSLLLFFLFSHASFAQMQRVILTNNGNAAQPIIFPVVNNFANAVTSCSLDTILLTTQAQINNFATNYPTCANPKYLIINGLGASPAITSLAGLGNITQVINKLKITNTSIINLSQLTLLTQIGDTLELEKNNLLTSIGLNNLTQLGSIYFKNLPALTSIAGLSNNITIMNNVRLDSTLALSNILGLGNITHYNGNVEIGYTAITGFSALNNCTYINGWMLINNNPNVISLGLTNLTHCGYFLLSDMPLLTSMAGLTTNITNTQTGTFWVINTGVTSLNGLQNLTGTSNFYINGNPNLTNITALQNLSGDIGGGFSIYGNPLLTSIAPLSNITAVSGDGIIEISYNNISTLNGLQNIINIGKGLRVVGNNNLTTLSALNNNLVIQNNPDSYNGIKDSVEIFDNTQLVLCSDTSICYYLNGGGAAFINNNAVGCNTIAEILSTCTTGINYNDLEDNCCIYNAISIIQGQIKSGNVGHYIGLDGNGDPVFDDYDTYRIIMPFNGAFKLFITAKNDSSCYESTVTNLHVDILDENNNGVQYKTLFNWSINDTCNLLKTDSFKFRAYRADTFYLRLHGNKISYSFYWQALDSCATDVEPNNHAGSAVFITPQQIKKGIIFFKKTVTTQNDIDDYYKTVLPVTGNIDVFLKITNRENSLPPSPSRFNFSWGYSASSNFTNTNFVSLPPVDEVIYDTLHICGFANDTTYFKIRSLQEGYEYELSYTIKDTLANDVNEPNNNFATATVINVNQIKSGNLRFSGVIADNEDYYQTVIPQNGIVKIIVQANTLKCSPGNITMYGFNKAQNFVFSKLISNNNNIPLSTTVNDTILLCGQPTDTFYFRFNSFTPFQYQFRYFMQDTVPNFTDPEINNSFATATTFNENDSITAKIKFAQGAGLDNDDYYRTVLPKDGTMKIFVQAKNYECSGNYIRVEGYDRRKNTGQIFSKYVSGNTNVSPLQIVYDTILLCGRAADTFYIHYDAFGKFVYNFKYQMLDSSVNDVEPNNSFSTAININENQTKLGHIKYNSNGGSDDFDYYQTILPKDGTVKVYIKAKNTSCANGQYMYARFYDRRQGNGEFYQKYIPNSASVPAGATIYDTITICNRAADTMYMRLEATNPFQYEIKYEVKDTSANDIEPNNSFAAAININENQTKVGHIKYYSNGGSDDYDYYKTILPKDGTVKVYIKAKNTSCANGQYMFTRFYDRRQGNGEFYQKYVPSSASVPAGNIIYDTITLCNRAADTMYIRFEAPNPFQYEIKYEVVDTSANDIEPNNSFTQATAVGSAQIKKGHIKYMSNGVADDYDYYKFIFSSTDSLKIQLQAINKSCANGQYMFLRMYDKNFNEFLNRYFPITGNALINQIIYDSIKILVNAPDTIYLRLEASNAFQYQLSTQILCG